MNGCMSTKFGLLIDFDLPNTVASTSRKPELKLNSRGSHLEKFIWRHITALGDPIWMKFGSFMQNIMQITEMWSKSKPEEEFQYGGRLILQNGNSGISAADWVILAIFGMLIDIYILKKVTSPSPIRKWNCATTAAILKIDKTSYLRCEWSDIGDMWHADAEWHDNGDEVKIETEKMTDWKRRNAHWSCRCVSPGCYTNVRVCVFNGVAKLHNLLNCGTGTDALTHR